MLHINLSTRPFYNERAVQAGLAALLALAVVFTAFNAVRWRSLSVRYQALLSRVGGDERAAAGMRREAERVRRGLNRADLDRVAAEAREANELIDRRVFSWTGLLNVVESTLPPGVRLLSLRPATDREGRLTITMVALAREPEDIQRFVDRLESGGPFRQVVSRSETTGPDGLLEVALEGQYMPGLPAPVAPAAAGREE
jgi:hypothetical protein